MSIFTEILAMVVGYGLKTLGEKDDMERSRTYDGVVEIIFKSDASTFDQRQFFNLLSRDKSEAYYIAFAEIVKKDDYWLSKIKLMEDLNKKF